MLLILLALCLLLLGEAALCEANGQCRLVVPQGLVANAPTPSASLLPNATSGSALPQSSALPTNSTNTTFTPFNYGKDVIRGVNLGGWFVLEPWITPSIFQNTNNSSIIDEYTFGQMQNNNTALDILQNHWETWITEDDFRAIKAAGLNHVRIPLGYWSVPITSADTNYSTSMSPYVPGAWPYLLQALNWAKSNGLHVIVDLHGAPLSQNGYDNSGQRGSALWASDPNNVLRTLDIIKFIAEQIGGMIDVLELLNEPVGFQADIGAAIRQYWQQGYQVVRNAAGNDIQVMIGDAFLGVDAWAGYLTYPSAQGVFMDYHEYQIFNYDQIDLSLPGHINYTCQSISDLSSFAKSNINTIIGEWSVAPTDCAKWLNGRGVGSRWDGSWQPNNPVFGSCDGWTGNMSNWSADYKTFLRQYWEAQADIGESVQGWVFWTWKVENADEWSYQRGLEGGWIPQDPTDRTYPNICSNQ